MIATLAGLSTTETLGVVIMLGLIGFVYRSSPPVPASAYVGGLLKRPISSQRTCEPDCIVCSYCGVENDTIYTYCSDCGGRLIVPSETW